MHRLVLICYFLLLACATRAQVRWEKTFAGPNDDACQVRQTPDGGFIFLGSIGFTYYLVRTDALGDTLWTRKPFWADFCALATTADGGFLLTGTTATNVRDFVSYKLDAFGDSVWAHVYTDTLDQGHYTVLETDDGGFVITGYTETISNQYDMYVIRTDPGGNLLWRQTYGTANFDLGAMPAINRDDGFMFVTTTNGGGPSGFLAVVTDPQGAVLWTRTYSTPTGIGGAVATALSDGGYLLCGWDAQQNYNSYLLRTDSAGNPLWSQNYGGFGFETRSSRGAIEDANGGFTFVTSTDKSFGPGTDRDIALVRVDSVGNLMRMARIGGNAEDMPRYFEQTSDGGYILLGYTYSFSPGWKEIYLIRLDSAGCDEQFYDLGVPQHDTLCGADTLWLDAGAGFSSYAWSNGATSQILPVTAADTYYVAATDSNGCLNYSSLVFVLAKPGPSFNFVDQGNFLVDFYGAPGDALSWSWDFGDGQTASVKNPSHVYPRDGTYIACLTAEIEGCGFLTTCDTLVFAGVGVDIAQEAEQIDLQYDSASDHLLIRTGEVAGKFVLMDLQGQRIWEMQLENNEKCELNASLLANGCYIYSYQAKSNTWDSGKIWIAR